jgi:hypothetical protein
MGIIKNVYELLFERMWLNVVGMSRPAAGASLPRTPIYTASLNTLFRKMPNVCVSKLTLFPPSSQKTRTVKKKKKIPRQEINNTILLPFWKEKNIE